MTTYCEDLQWLATLFPKGPRGTAPEITMITHAPQGSGSSLVGVHSPLHPDLPNWVRLVIPRIKDGPSDYETQHMSECAGIRVEERQFRLSYVDTTSRVHVPLLP